MGLNEETVLFASIYFPIEGDTFLVLSQFTKYILPLDTLERNLFGLEYILAKLMLMGSCGPF